jgi:hypothetical protein
MFDGAPRRIIHGKMDKNNPKEKKKFEEETSGERNSHV